MTSPYGVKVSKQETDVKSATENSLNLSSKYETLKVKTTGTLVVELPSETISDDYAAYSSQVEHGLSYPPFYLPSARRLENAGYSTTNDFIVNDNCYFVPLLFGYGPSLTGEIISLYVTSTDIILDVFRSATFLPITFGAHDVICHYTIFYNCIDEELDLVS